MSVRECLTCGKAFPKKGKTLTCSAACKAARRKLYLKEYQRANYSDPKDPPREKRKDGGA